MQTKYYIAILYILYAFVKIIIGSCLFILPLKTISTTPVLKIFTKEASDTTLAGRMYEYVLFVFGIYSLLEGLSLLEQLPHSMIAFLELKTTQYTIFIILGTILTVFYALVLYTRIPISKNNAHYDTYQLFGFYGGISFLVMPIIGELLAYAVPAYRNLSIELKSAFIIGLVIVIAIIADLIFTYLKRNNESVTQVLPPNVQVQLEVAQAVKDTVIGNKSPATQ